MEDEDGGEPEKAENRILGYMHQFSTDGDVHEMTIRFQRCRTLCDSSQDTDQKPRRRAWSFHYSPLRLFAVFKMSMSLPLVFDRTPHSCISNQSRANAVPAYCLTYKG